ncbi:YceD family protein, partial [Bacillus safensis]|uniref:YceD family protein n=1 Tax=Bacillus safensis TaxID=561879 RepID=UPI002FFF42B3
TDDIEDEDVSVVEDDIIDLTPIVKEEILLEVPMQIFCDQTDVKGAAPQEGNDWAVISEDAHQNRIDPRLEGLNNFFVFTRYFMCFLSLLFFF